MAYADRRALIAELEGILDCRILSYFLSDRETFPPDISGFTLNLLSEPQLLFVDHVRTIGKQKHLVLFLYTRGGATDSVWRLISVLREFSDKLTVVVPFRAHSAGTLICLGADQIIMAGTAELSPIDPTTGNQFNPVDPSNPENRFGISVEDVAAYFELSNERADITHAGQGLEVLKELIRTVHPLALGNVQRVYTQIRELARKLLQLHMDEERDKERIERIIEALTKTFYSHVHAISPGEAIPLFGDWVRRPTENEDRVIWGLFNSYAEILGLRSKFILAEYMGDTPFRDLTVTGGFIETKETSHVFETEIRVTQRPNLPPNVQIQVPAGAHIPVVPWGSRAYDYSIKKMGWKRNEAEV